MAPVLERVEGLRADVGGAQRVSLSELARGREWRDALPERGVLEVTDRSQTAGWLLSDAYVSELLGVIDDLSAELEERQAREIADAREGYRDWRGGEELARGALSYLDEMLPLMEGAAGGR